MADSTVSDQPTVYTNDLLRELSDEESHQAMCDTLEGAKEGAEMLLPLEDGTRVGYIYDGKELWHRRDTKAAQVLRNSAKRQVAKHG